MKNLFFLLLIILLSNCKKEPQPENNEKQNPQTEALEKLVMMQKASFDIPGLAVGIIKNGEVVYAKGLGVQALDTGDSLTTRSLFHMASVSKPFVATAIVQLVEQGKIELDKKLTHYLPYFKMKDERYREITIIQMLNHTSGIPDVEDYEWDKPQYDDEAAERYVRSFKNEALDFTPGQDYNYSNAAFDILADVIAKVSGMTFENYMKKYIFEPVGMTNSTFYKPEVPQKLATKPHTLGNQLEMSVGDLYPYNRIHAPSSTLHSNIDDLLLWAKVNLNKGKINGKSIYNDNSYALLTSGSVKTKGKDSICLSWFASQIGDYRMLGHSGGDEGYRTYFGFIPEQKAAVVLMANNDLFWSGYAANYLLNYIFSGVPKVWKVPIHFKLKDHILNEGIEKCKEIYLYQKQNFPEKYIYDSWCLDDLGYWLLDRGHPEKALEVFKFNIDLEPDHAGWVDSVGDAYRAMDNKEMAITWYKKALEMKPTQDFSRRKLRELTGE